MMGKYVGIEFLRFEYMNESLGIRKYPAELKQPR